jgi:hypothetical protein
VTSDTAVTITHHLYQSICLSPFGSNPSQPLSGCCRMKGLSRLCARFGDSSDLESRPGGSEVCKPCWLHHPQKCASVAGFIILRSVQALLASSSSEVSITSILLCLHQEIHPSKCHPSKCHPSKCHPSKCQRAHFRVYCPCLCRWREIVLFEDCHSMAFFG